MIVTYLFKQTESFDPEGKQALNSEKRNDDHYYKFLELFLKSLAITNPDREVFLKLYNFTEEECVYFESLNKNLSIENNKIDFSNSKIEDFLKKHHECYLNLIKEKLIDNEKVIYLDVDCLVRGGLEEIYEILNQNDVTIQTHKNDPYGDINCQHDRSKICAGVMGFKGEKAIKFIREWQDMYKNMKIDVNTNDGHSSPSWWTCQHALYLTYKKTTEMKTISFFDLPQKLHDSQMTERGVIWHGNMWDKGENLRTFERELDNIINEKRK